jgi:transposase InsO family protein
VISGIKDPILGMPFLETSKAKIDFSERSIELPSWRGGTTKVTECNVLNLNQTQPVQETEGQTVSSRQTVPDVQLSLTEVEEILNVSEHQNCQNLLLFGMNSEALDFDECTYEFTKGDESVRYISGLNLTPAEKQELLKHKKVFSELPKSLPPNRNCDHSIKLKPDSEPFYSRPYNLSAKESQEMEKQITDLLNRNWIRESKSPHGAPAFMVKKKDTSELRMCIDYRKLNGNTIVDPYPIPNIDILISRAASGKFFSKIDLKSGYYQIRVRDQDVAKTGFVVPSGHYEFAVMPFGLSNAPRTFQRAMDQLFNGKKGFMSIFQDDLLIFSETRQQHLKDVCEALTLLAENDFRSNTKKCQFFMDQVEFCGFVITNGCIKPQFEKVKCIKEWPIPQGVKQLRRFLGFASYYRRFIRNFGGLTCPLTNLLKKDQQWRWSDQEGEAFKAVQNALCSDVVLISPKPSMPSVIETDASGSAIGSILYQQDDRGDWKPVCYRSRKLNVHERNYSTHKKELLAVVDAIKCFRTTVYGNKITVETDHSSLRYLKVGPDTNPQLVRWIEFLSLFDITWRHRKGVENQAADALSRCHECDEIENGKSEPKRKMKLSAIRMSRNDELLNPDVWKDAYEKDEKWSERWKEGKDVHKGMLVHERRYLVPQSLEEKLIRRYHEAPTSGHPGINKTYELINRYFIIPDLKKKISDVVKVCDVCQRTKVLRTKPQGLLQPMSTEPLEKFQSISMDFVSVPQSKQGRDMILVIVERSTRFVIAMAVKKEISAEECAEILVSKIVSKFGLVSEIVSDRDPRFTAKVYREMCFKLGVTQSMSTSHHPQTDGLTERMNSTILQVIRTMIMEADAHEDEWERFLPTATMSINNTPCSATGASPHYLMFGYHPVLPHEIPRVPSKPEDAEERVERMRKEFDNAQRKILEMNERMKDYANEKRSEPPEYKVGDQVLLRTEQGKLQGRYTGPYTVTEVISPVVIRIDLETRGCNSFHVSQVKKYFTSERVLETEQSTNDSAESSTDVKECGKFGEVCLKTRMKIGGCLFCKRCHRSLHTEHGDRYKCTKYIDHRKIEVNSLKKSNVPKTLNEQVIANGNQKTPSTYQKDISNVSNKKGSVRSTVLSVANHQVQGETQYCPEMMYAQPISTESPESHDPLRQASRESICFNLFRTMLGAQWEIMRRIIHQTIP